MTRNLLFYADTHFGDPNIHQHQPARLAWGDTVEERDATQIERWNSVVAPKDEVWFLGDFARDKKTALRIRPQLNGSIHLIIGNHDAQNKIDRLPGLWASVHMAHYLRVNKERIYLHHTACMVWWSSSHGSFHLFGHSHGNLIHPGRAMDVGADVLGYPRTWDDLRAQIVDKPPVDHHGPNAGVPAYPDQPD